MYLLRINMRGEFEDMDSGIYLVPEFTRVLNSLKYGAKALKAVALYCDYQSPFRFTEEGAQRIAAIASVLYGETKLHYWKDAAIEDCKTAYEYLQKDPIREHLKALITQLEEFDKLLKVPTKDMDEIQKRLKVMKEVELLRKQINSTREEVASSVQTVTIKGNKIMSWLEERQFRIEQQNKIQNA